MLEVLSNFTLHSVQVAHRPQSGYVQITVSAAPLKSAALMTSSFSMLSGSNLKHYAVVPTGKASFIPSHVEMKLAACHSTPKQNQAI
jgi:hypothetical protein